MFFFIWFWNGGLWWNDGRSIRPWQAYIRLRQAAAIAMPCLPSTAPTPASCSSSRRVFAYFQPFLSFNGIFSPRFNSCTFFRQLQLTLDCQQSTPTTDMRFSQITPITHHFWVPEHPRREPWATTWRTLRTLLIFALGKMVDTDANGSLAATSLRLGAKVFFVSSFLFHPSADLFLVFFDF